MPAYNQPSNDNISDIFNQINVVPDRLQGSDMFLDIITWNIKYFNDRSPERVELITNILAELNADVIVFQEIYEGSLDIICDKLAERGAGYYHVEYGTTGGQQRAALMWDMDWVRSKDEVGELDAARRVKVFVNGREKKVFPRLPLHGYFTGIRESNDNFDFNLLGLHLKSKMGGGGEQRQAAGDWLANWFQSSNLDDDIIITGDWNNTPDSDDWRAIQALEELGQLRFEAINDNTEISHLYYRNRTNIGSKIDLILLSDEAAENVAVDPDTVVWNNLGSGLIN